VHTEDDPAAVKASPSRLTPDDERAKARLPLLTDVMARLGTRRHRQVMTPHPGSTAGEQSTGATKSGTLRAAIFGVNDGLVSNTSLIMGFAGAGVDKAVILLAGIAGLLAGAFSMGAGEYISMKVQREVYERLIHLEAHELAMEPEEEREELAQIYVRKGVPAELAARLAESVMADPKLALDTHAREELGLDPEHGLGSPWGAAASSFLTFSFGALVPLAPFLFASGVGATVVSATLAGLTLAAVGAAMSVLTGKSAVASGARQLLVGGIAAAITFGIGTILGVTT
jgi:VIT1/CCC1 family predicted Fe2+/Mn2+ transporter